MRLRTFTLGCLYDEDLLRNLAEQDVCLPYRYLPQISQQTRMGLVAAACRRAAEHGGLVLLGANGDGVPLGVVALAPADFDSSLFGMNIAKLCLLAARGDERERRRIKRELLTQALAAAPALAAVHAKLPLTDLSGIGALESVGFFTAAGWIDYGLCPERWEPPRRKPPCFIRHARREDLPLLEQIAATSFTLDRFHADPQLSRIRSDQLHRYWIRNAFHQRLAQVILVAENGGGEPVGFIAYNYHDEDPDRLDGVRVANVILNATREDARGKGVFTQLLTECILDCQGRVDFLHVETQTNNFDAQRVWANLGLRPVDAGLNLHWYRHAEDTAREAAP